MLTYLFKKLFTLIPVLFGVALTVFLIVRLTPGDPATILLGPDAEPATIAALREKLGLNQSLPTQFARYLGGLLNGDLGNSIRSGQPVMEDIRARYPYTFLLALVSLLLAVPAGIFLGTVAAVKRGTLLDSVVMILALIGRSAPTFWMGLMLMIVFAYYLHWFPASGFGGSLLSWEGWRSIALPAATLALSSTATFARLTRSSLLESLSQDYVRTARAKGVKPVTVIRRHALMNALVPIVTLIGLDFGALLGGAVVTETVFAWPGMGTLVVTAIGNRDYPVVQAVVIMIALTFVVINVLVDLTYGFLDPRIRYD